MMVISFCRTYVSRGPARLNLKCWIPARLFLEKWLESFLRTGSAARAWVRGRCLRPRKNGQWVLFNDRKVGVSETLPRGMGSGCFIMLSGPAHPKRNDRNLALLVKDFIRNGLPPLPLTKF